MAWGYWSAASVTTSDRGRSPRRNQNGSATTGGGGSTSGGGSHNVAAPAVPVPIVEERPPSVTVHNNQVSGEIPDGTGNCGSVENCRKYAVNYFYLRRGWGINRGRKKFCTLRHRLYYSRVLFVWVVEYIFSFTTDVTIYIGLHFRR